MILSEFIRLLKEVESSGNGDLPVALADWSEEYCQPNEQHAEEVTVRDGQVVIGMK